MKFKFFYLALTSFLFIHCSSNEYELEDRYLECFYNHYLEEGTDIKQVIDSLEDIYVKYQVLESESGESYIDFIRKIELNKDLPQNPLIKESILKLSRIPSQFFCGDTAILLDTLALKKSKIIRIKNLFDSFSDYGEIVPELIAKRILQTFDYKDFEHDFYKTIALIAITNIIYLDDQGDITRKLPPPANNKNYQINKNDVLTVLANGKDEIYINGKPTGLTSLKKKTKEFILEKASKREIDIPIIGRQQVSNGVISFQSDRHGSYELYKNVHNVLVEAFNEMRNDFSMKIFKMPFEKLDKEKKNAIKKMCPQAISETVSDINK